MTTEETLWKRYRRKKSTTNRNALVVHYLPLLEFHATRMLRKLGTSVEYDEVFSAGCVGLVKAVEAYSPQKSKFTTYLSVRVRGEVLDWAREVDHQPRIVRGFETSRRHAMDRILHEHPHPTESEIISRMELSVSRYQMLSRLSTHGNVVHMDAVVDQDDDPISWEDKHSSKPDKDVSLDWLEDTLGKSLSTKEKVALFDTYVRGVSCKDVGKMLGYSESRISQLRLDSLNKIKAKYMLDGDILGKVKG